MSSTTYTPSVRTIVDTLPRRGVLTDALLILAGVAVVTALAYVQIPMWPVPITGQTLGVVLVGASLGARRGATALFAYMMLGLAGLPIFAGGTGGLIALAKPSFGFIIGFIAAAALVGWFADRRWDRRPIQSLSAFLLASLVPFVIGVPYMGVVLGVMGLPNDPATLLALGFFPFIVGGIIKWLLAAALLPLAWKIVGAADARRED